MNKKIFVILIAVIIAIFIVNFSLDQPKVENNIAFHATLADPNLYSDGVYADSFFIDTGEYSFRFVPNGSSPEILSITLNGENFDFSEDYKLESISHQTGISEYFTWKYTGNKIFLVPEKQEISLTINPNGKMMGSVSVDILQN